MFSALQYANAAHFEDKDYFIFIFEKLSDYLKMATAIEELISIDTICVSVIDDNRVTLVVSTDDCL